MTKWEELSAKERREALRPFAIRQQICPFTVEELTRWAILTTLAAFDGNRTYTARHLGLSIRTVRNYINRYRKQGFFVPSVSDVPRLVRNAERMDDEIGA